MNSSIQLNGDVLQVIFQQLEDKDLRNCEAVCRQWRDISLGVTLWKRFFDGKSKSFPLWRRAQKKLESNQLTLRYEQYRGVCKEILQEERHWRTGIFTTFTYDVNRGVSFTLTIGDDCAVWNYRPRAHPETCKGFAFLDTQSMKITEIPLYGESKIENGMLVSKIGRTVKIWNPKMNWILNEVPGGSSPFSSRQVFPAGELVVCYSYSRNSRERFEVWNMENPPTLLRSRICDDRMWTISEVDNQFIVRSQC